MGHYPRVTPVALDLTTADQIDYGDEMSTKLFAITTFALTALASQSRRSHHRTW